MGYIFNIARTLVVAYSRQSYASQFIASGPVMNMFTGNKNKLLGYVTITPTADITVKIGTTNGGEEIMQATELTNGVAQALNIGYHFKEDQQLFITGLTAGTIIDIFCF